MEPNLRLSQSENASIRSPIVPGCGAVVPANIEKTVSKIKPNFAGLDPRHAYV